jgi:chemotaxis protein MotA
VARLEWAAATVQNGRPFAYALENPMDIMTGVGLVCGIIVVSVMIFMGGDLHMFISEHAALIVIGGSIAATMIRFPLSAILHGLPLGAKFAFTISRLSARDLVDELARIAEIARKQGPVGLEKVETDEPFLAKGIRYVADGYDLEFIRDNLERDRDNFLMHLDEGGKIYRAIGDCTPAFGMVGTLIGMVQMFANMTDPSKLGPFMATALLATLYGDREPVLPADRRQAAWQAARRGDQPHADHRRHSDDPRFQKPDADPGNVAGLLAGKTSPGRRRAGTGLTGG